MPREEPFRVGISGSYGGLNLGDEAILQVLIENVRRLGHTEITVFTRDAKDTTRRHAVEGALEARCLSRGEARQAVRELDLLVLGGGGILFDADAMTYLREVTLAHEEGTPVMVYAVSAGPLVDPPVRRCVRDALELAARITVRDRRSRQLLEDIGVESRIDVTADPAVLLEPEALTLEEILRAEAIDPDARLIGFSVREPGPAAPDLDIGHYHRLVANVADFVVERLGAEVIFVPLERNTYDVQHSHGVVAQMHHAQCATVLKREYTPGQLLTLLGRFEFAIGMRLHFLILSALAGIPFVALPYASKVSGFLEELGIEAPALGDVSAGQLIAYVDRAWDMRSDLRARIEAATPELKARARASATILASLVSDLRAHRESERVR
jgi:polysaccharide pyruvyl transferase CsaB